ncbi:hypothetical protein [Gulosibacter chungangensis]|uniref:Uncharacterized protein n=1 Tax=Gulosibacter chungangensis TaxID=979746 RepID=A0A7J5B8V8_9MICO|nr:hypothetical protein F8O05_12245 [Gulosibacter chungangensis]
MIAYIREYRDRFGGEPICAVLCAHGTQIDPSTFHADQDRGFGPSDRELSDVITIDAMVHGPDIRDYVECRCADGMTDREIRRLRKRYLVR